jgi:hypothetical protein
VNTLGSSADLFSPIRRAKIIWVPSPKPTIIIKQVIKSRPAFPTASNAKVSYLLKKAESVSKTIDCINPDTINGIETFRRLEYL